MTVPAGRTGLLMDDVALVLGDGQGQVTALDSVSLRVAPGEIVAVVGPSGAGKSSLLAVAGGLAAPDSGRVIVDGIDVASATPSTRARYRRDQVGFVFQSGNLIPALTAMDQLRYALRISGRTPERRGAQAMLDRVGIGHRAGARPHQLSGGERQRVGIARALITEPSILLVDEPTSALDRARSHDIARLLTSATHEGGVATIVVTHDQDILDHFDRVVQMVDGRLMNAG